MPNSLPLLHIQPSNGWLNDPNGIVHDGSRWHVFYQANPRDTLHRDISWGHVSSPDLVGWSHHPTAFEPTPGGPDAGGCWTGVFLPWLPRPAVAYSGFVQGEASTTVCVREALDGALVHWGDPRVVARTPEGVAEMRDPFCFTWAGRHLAIVGARLATGAAAVLLYDVADPDAWSYAGVLLRSDELAVRAPKADIWECPQLVVAGDRCWLIVSLWLDGVTLNVVAFTGTVTDRDGLPSLTVTDVEQVDAGGPFYAPQVALDGDRAPLLFGWIREFDAESAAANGVSGCLTLPRRVDTSGRHLRFAVDAGLQRYADESRVIPLELAAHTTVGLPSPARIRGSADVVRLSGRSQTIEIHCPDGEFELWTDGEVAEFFPAGAPPLTLRDSGTAHWQVSAGSAVSLDVRALAPPPTPAAPAATAATTASPAS